MSKLLNSRYSVVLVAMVESFDASAIVPGKANARVPSGRFDSVSIGCGQIQDQYDQAVRDLEKASKSGTQAEYNAALARVQSLIRQWNGSPCSRTFGSLLYRKAPISKDTVRGGTPTLAPVTNSNGSSNGGLTNGTKPTAGKPRSVLKTKMFRRE